YDWSDKEEICRKLYIDEQKNTSEIIQYFVEHFNTDPSELPCRKGFHRQFQAWGFPSRGKTWDGDQANAASARIRELWEQNVNQKDIKSMMDEEGWELSTYDFTKLWRKNNLRLRNEHGYKAPSADGKKRKRPSAAIEDAMAEQLVETPSRPEPISAPMDAEEAAARAQRLFEIQVESDQRLQARKRRRRIRGYGHLPPDAAGTAPRYASETSLDECKAYLSLDNETYVQIRKEFTAICEEHGILKKTECAEGVWEDSKRQLIDGNAHLSAVMHPLQPELDKKNVALECLAADVTKRMRVTGRAITIADANNILDLNPTESKAVRRAFYEILAADKFESRLVSGEDHWNELRQQWYQTSEKLQQVVAANDPNKMRAVDLLGRDTMKRFREDRNSRGERIHLEPPTAPMDPSLLTDPQILGGTDDDLDNKIPHSLMAQLAQASSQLSFDLDPALAGSGPFATSVPDPTMPTTTIAPTGPPITAYFRLAPTSQLSTVHPRMWLGKLSTPSVHALHAAALSKLPTARVAKVQGLVKNEDGSEDCWLVESVDELLAYLAEAGEKVSFQVVLEDGVFV
ncbi:uncharacterized protein K489DRAFT_313719, partial [Dissoconium aciculare CBS 342.82]|uniref:Clr5 domain-containing protein n=1 Tax=Dissoconium aciculare CBS 342.82 TaxID=1314786 RepID=A0A6J3MCA9_9PEZI